MASVLGELFQKIADAIREQTGETGTMKPADFPGAILGIEAGGGGGEGSDANLEFATGSFRTASTNPGRVTVTHGKSEMPDFIAVWKTGLEEVNGSNRPMMSAWGMKAKFDSSTQTAVCCVGYSMADSTYGIDNATQSMQDAGYIFCPNDTTFQVGRIDSGNGLFLLVPNANYSWIAVYGMGGSSIDIALIESLNITPDFSLGNQIIVAQEGYAVKSAILLKPATLIPENVAKGVEIAGVVGTMAGGSSNDVRYVTFMNGDTVLYKKPVAVGDDCVDVYTKGLIEEPKKESTPQYNYTFYGWGASDGGAADANILKNITADKTVYVIYASTVRTYTITYLDDDGITVLHTEQVAYGSVPSYQPEKDGFVFAGWAEELVAVVGDATYTATWDVDNGVEIYNKTFNATNNDGNYGAYGGRSVPLVSGPAFEVGDTIIATIDGTEYEFVAYSSRISSSQGSKTFHCIGNVKVLKKYLGYTASYTAANYTDLNFFIGVDTSSTQYVTIYFTTSGSHAITLIKR